MTRRGQLLLAALLWLVVEPLAARAPQISLLTVGPGEIYWQRFGHNALLVRDAASGQATVYNYGVFDFHQENFFLNFARGQMLYRLDTTTLAWTLRGYAAEGRWLVEQPLNLDDAQREALAAYLDWNAQPENTEYRYDYFVSNCSTRVRDALDHVLHGQLQAQLGARGTPLTYRSESLALMAAEPALRFGMQLALGRAADRPLNEWQAGFIPMHLMTALRSVQVVDSEGRTWPLVADERWLLRAAAAPHAVPDASDAGLAVDAAGTDSPESHESWRAQAAWLLAGTLLALIWAVVARARAPVVLRVGAAALAVLYLGVNGAAGGVLVLGWAFTDHWVMADNPMLLLLNPLVWLLLPRAWRLHRGERSSFAEFPKVTGMAWTRALLPVVLAVAAISWAGCCAASAPPMLALLPVHLVLAWRLRH